jgi:hypothetical protein
MSPLSGRLAQKCYNAVRAAFVASAPPWHGGELGIGELLPARLCTQEVDGGPPPPPLSGGTAYHSLTVAYHDCQQVVQYGQDLREEAGCAGPDSGAVRDTLNDLAFALESVRAEWYSAAPYVAEWQFQLLLWTQDGTAAAPSEQPVNCGDAPGPADAADRGWDEFCTACRSLLAAGGAECTDLVDLTRRIAAVEDCARAYCASLDGLAGAAEAATFGALRHLEAAAARLCAASCELVDNEYIGLLAATGGWAPRPRPTRQDR